VLRIPDGLGWWRVIPGGDAWLARLPQLVGECAEAWDLRLGAPVEPAIIGLVLPATLPDGAEAMLKLSFPEDEESDREGDALAHWDGRGAARLLAQDRERGAILIERLRPGSVLWEVDDAEAVVIAAGVMRELWRPPPADHRFALLADRALRWQSELPGRWERAGHPCAREVIDRAVVWIGELVATQPELVVCHQDMHGANILRATRSPWLAIDPKPVVGEPAFDVASLVRDRRPELLAADRPARILARRLDQLVEQLGLDRERMRGWAVAHALAWGIEHRGAVHAPEVAVAETLALMPA
jgi:streptomycin 6-kinase